MLVRSGVDLVIAKKERLDFLTLSTQYAASNSFYKVSY
jgi:hypothetical protein